MQIENPEGGEPSSSQGSVGDTGKDESKEESAPLGDVKLEIKNSGDELAIKIAQNIEDCIDTQRAPLPADRESIKLIALTNLAKILTVVAESRKTLVRPGHLSTQTFNLHSAEISKRTGIKPTVDEAAYNTYAYADSVLKKFILPAHPKEGDVKVIKSEARKVTTKQSNTLFKNLVCVEETDDTNGRLLSTRFAIIKQRPT